MIDRDIPWFNPRQMSDKVVAALATGRADLVQEFFTVANSLAAKPHSGSQHWLITGPRGAGKSFFLRLIQTGFAKQMPQQAVFVLMPEELPNVFSPHEWLREIQRHLPSDEKSPGASAAWQVREPSREWESALHDLKSDLGDRFLVVGVENFDQLMKTAFEGNVEASQLRWLMENESQIMLLATAVEGDFDNNYHARLFRQFHHIPLRRWDEADHCHYLDRRAELLGIEATSRQRSRIRAYSYFTGGSARVAAVLAASILDHQDPLDASADLRVALDRLSDYYRSQQDRMPPNSRKLFDALIRGGEPASQVELAERIGSKQSDISRAFRWLVDNGYVCSQHKPGSKSHAYRISDRLFVQFYRMRYLYPNEPCQLAILSDLLAATIEFSDKWRLAERYLGKEMLPEAEHMIRLALREKGVDEATINQSTRDLAKALKMGNEWKWLERRQSQVLREFAWDCVHRFKSNEEFLEALESARQALRVKFGADADWVISYCESCNIDCLIEYYMISFTLGLGVNPRTRLESVDFKEFQEATKSILGDRRQPLLSAVLCAVQDLDGGSKTVSLFERIVNLTAPERLIVMPLAYINLLDLDETDFSCDLKLRSRLGNVIQTLMNFEDEFSRICAWQLTFCLGHFEESLRDVPPNCKTWCAPMYSRCLSQLGLIQEALDVCLKCLNVFKPNRLVDQVVCLRMLLGQDSDAWQTVEEYRTTASPNLPWALRQLGEAIQLHAKKHPTHESFAFAMGLLQQIKDRRDWLPIVPVIQAIWLRMIELEVPLAFIQDLTGELPSIFDHGDKELEITVETLALWIRYLQTPREAREDFLAKIDPDIANTIQVSSRNLRARPRWNYGIDNP